MDGCAEVVGREEAVGVCEVEVEEEEKENAEGVHFLGVCECWVLVEDR